MAYHFTIKQMFLGIFGFLFSGPIGMMRAMLMADPAYAKTNMEYREAVIRLEQLLSEYVKKYPNSPTAIAREQLKKENGTFYQTTQAIMRGKK